MIEGRDILLPNLSGIEGLDLAVRCVLRHWGCAIIENAVTGEIYNGYNMTPFGAATELFVYIGAKAKRVADEGARPDDDDSYTQFLYLLARPEALTVVVQDPDDEKIGPVLSTLKSCRLPSVSSPPAPGAPAE